MPAGPRWGWDSGKTSELLSGMGVSALEPEAADSENIPQEPLSRSRPRSPARKRLKRGGDKDFVIVRRAKQSRSRDDPPGKGDTRLAACRAASG